MIKSVFLLTHTHVLSETEENVKLIGVFSTRELASQAESNAKRLSGFAESAEGFHIEEYELDVSHWNEGFFTWRPPEKDEGPE